MSNPMSNKVRSVIIITEDGTEHTFAGPQGSFHVRDSNNGELPGPKRLDWKTVTVHLQLHDN